MRILQHEQLAVGDIILTTTGLKVSQGIRLITTSDISHAMLYVDSCSVIDATSEGVHARNTQRILLEDNHAVHVLRLKSPLNDCDLNTVCDFVRSCVGTEYSTLEAVGSAPVLRDVLAFIGWRDAWGDKQFCSRLVAQAFAKVGIELVSNANFCTPNDLLESPLLEKVPDATRMALAADLRFNADAGADMNSRMRETTNAFLKSARARDAAIQDFDDVIKHLINNSTEDDFFVKALTESGYLTVWQMEFDLTPWHFDIQGMESIPNRSGVRDYCLAMVRDIGEARRRYIANANGFEQLFVNHPLETFKVLRDLHAKLLEIFHTRRAVAATWLHRHATNELSPIVLFPHTDEWFAQMDIDEPQKAAMTRHVLSMENRRDVCSICGKDPAPAYRREGPALPGLLTPTLRLCESCLAERMQSYNEAYVPFNSSNSP